MHAYERTAPFPTPGVSPVYVTVGSGGNREGHARGWQQPQPDWSAFRQGSAYGAGTFSVTNATHAAWTWHANRAWALHSQDGATIVNPFQLE